MITFDSGRDIFQQRETNSQGEDILIICSEEYVRQKFNINSDNGPEELQKKQREAVEGLFKDIISNTQNYNDSIRMGKNGLKIVILTTTPAGANNVENYLREIGLCE